MRPKRPPLQSRINNERVAVVSAVLSGLSVCAEVVRRDIARYSTSKSKEGQKENLVTKELTKIEDYGFLSDTQTGALVSRDGCVDWLCFPRFDSPACFASLLGDQNNGRWLFYPEGKIDKSSRRYRGDTLILETEIEAKSGP